MGFDLHTHSIYSDGTLKPAELINKAMSRELQGIALTDHDSIAGIHEAALEASKHEFTLITGVELTTDYGTNEVHILGYNFDLTSERLLQKLEKIALAQNERAKLILKKLKQHNLPLSWEKVQARTTE